MWERRTLGANYPIQTPAYSYTKMAEMSWNYTELMTSKQALYSIIELQVDSVTSNWTPKVSICTVCYCILRGV